MAWFSDALGAILKQGLSISVPIEWTGYNMNQWHFFNDEEVKGLDKELCAMLDWARGRAGVPFIITCGVRTPEQNDQVGGVKDSSHIRGLAVDLACSDSFSRYKMVQSLLLAGFKRMGIYDKHIHVDRDTTLPEQVCWIGLSH